MPAHVLDDAAPARARATAAPRQCNTCMPTLWSGARAHPRRGPRPRTSSTRPTPRTSSTTPRLHAQLQRLHLRTSSMTPAPARVLDDAPTRAHSQTTPAPAHVLDNATPARATATAAPAHVVLDNAHTRARPRDAYARARPQ
ncbi:hypothetical protein PLICRDRAFT_180526 [Plicaturopsis crispa FD-325 SS-3]|uniref:Uncharacterized protein n=1 Tax=Plicaturopsis crispa FD-325 SS-3 TaxID=944288 RepID=A0A0C9SQ29_PLICR|nr:hypothetical protein PLICRDRAFT_180526 [Plicaturopsis crispa FD-325 SS-3]